MFRVEPEGLALAEVAKGIDVRRDILDQMHVRAVQKIADPLPEMDAALFGIETVTPSVEETALSTSRDHRAASGLIAMCLPSVAGLPAWPRPWSHRAVAPA